jgi:hypothetical protein
VSLSRSPILIGDIGGLLETLPVVGILRLRFLFGVDSLDLIDREVSEGVLLSSISLRIEETF